MKIMWMIAYFSAILICKIPWLEFLRRRQVLIDQVQWMMIKIKVSIDNNPQQTIRDIAEELGISKLNIENNHLHK